MGLGELSGEEVPPDTVTHFPFSEHCFLLLMSLTCFSTTLFKCLWYPSQHYPSFFLFRVRSNYIAHIQLIYCVKLSHLLWCLNSREWLKIHVVCWVRLLIHRFMLRAVFFKPELWKLPSGAAPTGCPGLCSNCCLALLSYSRSWSSLSKSDGIPSR